MRSTSGPTPTSGWQYGHGRQVQHRLGKACTVSRRSRCQCVADNRNGGDQNADSSLDGSLNVQDALVDVIRLNVGKKKALEQLSDAVDDEKLKLIQKNDQAKEELDALQELNKARRNLAFGSAQADIDEKFRQMSSELKASREQMEADQQDLAAFKDKVQRDQQTGLWFKSLYSQPGRLPKADYDNEYVKAVNEATVDAMKRRSRKASFLFVSFVALSGFLLEVSSGSPPLSWQALTLAVMAVLAGLTAYQESRLDSESLTDVLKEESRSGDAKQ
eukprot:jgi/Ulvmu1/9917/UM057_0075.1